MRTPLRHLLFVLGFAAVLQAAPPAPAADFPLKDGDMWVMAGDSITAQHLHSNYFEAFCYARYPKLHFAFRNSGVGGHTIPSTLARFDYDIAPWKPTVVSVELGMNDQGGTPTDKFIANMGTMVERIRAIKARPVILAASPINNGDTLQTLKGTTGNKRLDQYATALKEYAAKEQIPYADQFHGLINIWGKNRPYDILNSSLGSLKQLAQDESAAGAEHLRAFLAAQEKNPPKFLTITGDPVHPGSAGQLMMAAALLKDLGATGFVSSATIDSAGKVVEAKGCSIDGIKAEDGKLSFDRLDECLPFPVPDDARAVVAFYPVVMELSQYTLKVPGLKAGNYTLKINDATVATLTGKDLETGVNLTTFPAGGQGKDANPVAAHGKAILAAVSAKEGVVGKWRDLSRDLALKKAKEDLQPQLAVLAKEIDELDGKIRETAKPKKLHFQIVPAP